MNLPGVSSFLQLTHSLSLEEGGQTALGPAVLLCVSIASRVPGSKVNIFCAKHKWRWQQQPRSYYTSCSVVQVIICTDGLANKGVGHLDSKLASSLCLHLCTYWSPDWWLIVTYHHRSKFRWGSGCCPDILRRPWSTGTWEKVCTVVKYTVDWENFTH